jgi:hypothetical protein
MLTINTKFSVGDPCYSFDSFSGTIYRNIVHTVTTSTSSITADTEVLYVLTHTTPQSKGRINNDQEYEQNLYTEAEVKEIANVWLINKSINIFSNAGL